MRSAKNIIMSGARQLVGSGGMQLRMVPMIDVVFLLLVFFLMTASFRSREGFLPAQLPRQALTVAAIELEPLLIRLHSLPDGSCQVQIADEPALTIARANPEVGFELLTEQLRAVLDSQGRTLADPVKLCPAAQTKWDHVVKAYDAIWQLDIQNIIFAMAEAP